jgi:hypothetical protein
VGQVLAVVVLLLALMAVILYLMPSHQQVAVVVELTDTEAVFQAVQAVVQHGPMDIVQVLERQDKVMMAVKTQHQAFFKVAVVAVAQGQ